MRKRKINYNIVIATDCDYSDGVTRVTSIRRYKQTLWFKNTVYSRYPVDNNDCITADICHGSIVFSAIRKDFTGKFCEEEIYLALLVAPER